MVKNDRSHEKILNSLIMSHNILGQKSLSHMRFWSNLVVHVMNQNRLTKDTHKTENLIQLLKKTIPIILLINKM